MKTNLNIGDTVIWPANDHYEAVFYVLDIDSKKGTARLGGRIGKYTAPLAELRIVISEPVVVEGDNPSGV